MNGRVSNIKGMIAAPARRWLARAVNTELFGGSRALGYGPMPRSTAEQHGLLRMGTGSYGRPEVLAFDGDKSHVRIGRYCSIAYGVLIIPGGEHRTDWVTTFPLDGATRRGHPFSRGDVLIGNDVWIGSGATILSGTTIGDGAVIGAGAVVAADVPAFAIAVGNPARVVRFRFEPDQIAALLEIQWWNWPEPKVQAATPDLLSSDVDMFVEKYRPR